MYLAALLEQARKAYQGQDPHGLAAARAIAEGIYASIKKDSDDAKDQGAAIALFTKALNDASSAWLLAATELYLEHRKLLDADEQLALATASVAAYEATMRERFWVQAHDTTVP
jgi:hypothetical protein